MTRWAAVAVDVVLVLVFVLIGRRTHEHPLDLGGLAATAWPFLTGLAVGWAVTLMLRRGAPRGRGDAGRGRRGRPSEQRARRAGPASPRPHGWLAAGVTVWAATVVVGMALRAASGQGTAPSFVVVATLVLGAFLVGWRLVAALARRQASSSSSAAKSSIESP